MNRVFVLLPNGVSVRGFRVGNQIHIPQQIGYAAVDEQWIDDFEIGKSFQTLRSLNYKIIN